MSRALLFIPKADIAWRTPPSNIHITHKKLERNLNRTSVDHYPRTQKLQRFKKINMRQFSKSRTQVLRRYRSFDISKLSTTSQKNKNIMFLNLRTNLLSFWFIHVPMHKGRHYRLFMKLKLYTNPSNGCFISNFKSVGQETWSALFPSTHFAVLEYFIRRTSGNKLRHVTWLC